MVLCYNDGKINFFGQDWLHEGLAKIGKDDRATAESEATVHGE